jgi:hypothetical protein
LGKIKNVPNHQPDEPSKYSGNVFTAKPKKGDSMAHPYDHYLLRMPSSSDDSKMSWNFGMVSAWYLHL